MSLPYLMTVNRETFNAFNFEHDQDHRYWWTSMRPVDWFTMVPYFADPAMPENGKWRIDHKYTHDEFLGPAGPLPVATLVIPSLIDINFRDSKQTQFWLWANLLEHYTANTLMQGLQIAPAITAG